jgi:choice-of-anchor A domain-containing protein
MKRSLVLLVALPLIIGLSCPVASANSISFDLGQAGPDQWAFLALGGGPVLLSGTVSGPVSDVGFVSPAAGTKMFSITAGYVQGNIYEGSTNITNIWPGAATPPTPAAPIIDDAKLNAAKADALAASTFYGAKSATPGFPTTINQTWGNLVIAGGPGENVLNLTQFSQFGGTITFTGGPTTYFVVNIAGTFARFGGHLEFGPDISPHDVLFNVTGTRAVDILNDTQGVLLAPYSKFYIKAATWTGEVIAGDQLSVMAGEVVNVHTPVPPSVFLMGTGLLGFGLLGWRRKKG